MILGGGGMLGHKMSQVLGDQLDTTATFRRLPTDPSVTELLGRCNLLHPLDANDLKGIARVLDENCPDVVVNCIGVVKQLDMGKDPIACISLNSLFPHLLAELCTERGIRLIHISTDCVFSGKLGLYREDSFADADDLYGRTKYLGEVAGAGCLTLRTSIIGRELSWAHGLVEWLLSQEGKSVKGFRRAIFSGLTTIELSRVILRIVTEFLDLSGVYQVAATPINKHDLLCMISDVYGLNVDIEPDDDFVCDRSLDGKRFREATGIVTPSWLDMIQAMYNDPTPYDEIRARLVSEG